MRWAFIGSSCMWGAEACVGVFLDATPPSQHCMGLAQYCHILSLLRQAPWDVQYGVRGVVVVVLVGVE